MTRRPSLTAMAAFLFCSAFHSAIVHSADAKFYTLADRWQKAQATGQTKNEAMSGSFASALANNETSSLDNVQSVPRPIEKRLSDLVATETTIEIQEKQSLIVLSDQPILKFVTTDEICIIETVTEKSIQIIGTSFGTSFIHVWDETGRKTFQIQVIPQKISNAVFQQKQRDIFEKTRSFKVGYTGSRSAFYTANIPRNLTRSSIDTTHLGTLEGDTPYGFLTSHAQGQAFNDKTIVTDMQVKLHDGKVGPFQRFDAAALDSRVTPDLLVFPSTRIRGVDVTHWTDDSKSLVWQGFYGREQSSIIGTLTPGVVSKRNRHSFLSGNTVDYRFNENAKIKAGFFTGAGKDRLDELNRRSEAVKGEFKVTPNTTYKPHLGFDDQHFAQTQDLTFRFDKLHIKNEFRDVGKHFTTMIGPPSRRGEIGYLLDVSSDPWQNVHFEGSFDIFRDRLVPNPEDLDKHNMHTNLALAIVPWEKSSLSFNFQDLDDTGRIGPTKSRTMGVQFNQQVHLLQTPVSFFSRYQNRDVEVLTNSTSDYIQDYFLLGMRMQTFWGINFSVQKELSRLDEPNVPSITHPHATVFEWDQDGRVSNTPFYYDWRVRLRDEEQTESLNSFMSGEDSTEFEAGLYYREYENLELFITGSLRAYDRESRTSTSAPRAEAELLTGVRGLWDTGYRWSVVGSFEGFVYKDMNGNGMRDPEDPGIKDVVVKAGDKETITDERGFYEVKGVSGNHALIIMDTAKIPYGFAPTTSVSQEVTIENGKTKQVDFGVTPKSEIRGVIFNDLDGDGRFQTTDIGVRKVMLRLDGQKAMRSNTIGVFSFADLAPGPHEVTLDLNSLPEGYLPYDTPTKRVDVTEGVPFELNFPLRAVRQISGQVFVDVDRNGQLNDADKTLANVRVRMGSQSVLTDKDGWYLFDEVNAGSLEISLDLASLPARVRPTESIIRKEFPTGPMTFSNSNIILVEELEKKEESYSVDAV